MPATIKVGAHVLRVIRRPSKQMKDDNGCYDPDKLEIHMRKGLRFSKSQEILRHEVIHASVNPVLSNVEGLNEEIFVDTLAPVDIQVLQDNPELVAYLCYREGK